MCSEIVLALLSLLQFQVAEFANIRRQLEVLEDRLDSVVQPRLTDALSNRKVTLALFLLCNPFLKVILYVFK